MSRTIHDSMTSERRVTHTDGAHANGHSIAELIREAVHELSKLVRQEFALAKTEMSEKVARTRRRTINLAIGAGVLLSGTVLLVIGLGYGGTALLAEMGVSQQQAYWLGPLIVGAIIAAIGAIWAYSAAKSLSNQNYYPDKTVDSLRDTGRTVRERTA